MGLSVDGTGRVFTREDGTPLRPAWISRRFGVIVSLEGLPPIRFHDLRHDLATMLRAAGQPIKVISKIPCHAASAFTADVHSEVADELPDAAAPAGYALRRQIQRGTRGGRLPWLMPDTCLRSRFRFPLPASCSNFPPPVPASGSGLCSRFGFPGYLFRFAVPC